MPFFGTVEPTARHLPPLAGHRLVVSPLLAPAPVETSRRRLTGRTSPLLGGIAVFALAGAISASFGTANQSIADQAFSTLPAAARSAAPVLSAGLLAPVAYAAPLSAAAPAAPAAKSATAAAKAHSLTIHRPTVHSAAFVTHADTANVTAMSSQLRRLRSCESGGNYREASGNGYYGAYQFDLSTWRGLGLTGYPSNASRQLQDVAVIRLQARKGWGPWPVCSYVAGLR